ncbi:hypothetical protein GN244_ATG17656 [Phytophthora infestans]|uniref:Uncharacterized protein n=1 Tax=Phytophthora infestans TaxID=4787 RepID=A0A833SS26_PHYIN|nr:hypothetical protein GN244_ATG17656 [Phytophthora infestans]
MCQKSRSMGRQRQTAGSPLVGSRVQTAPVNKPGRGVDGVDDPIVNQMEVKPVVNESSPIPVTEDQVCISEWGDHFAEVVEGQLAILPEEVTLPGNVKLEKTSESSMRALSRKRMS